jgi:hypothetical protein
VNKIILNYTRVIEILGHLIRCIEVKPASGMAQSIKDKRGTEDYRELAVFVALSQKT